MGFLVIFTKNAIELEVVSGELPPILALIFGLQQSVLVRAGGVAWPAVQRRPGTKPVLCTVHLYQCWAKL